MPARSAAYQFGFTIADALSSTKQAAGTQLNTPAPPTSGRMARSATPTNHFRVESRKPAPAAETTQAAPVYKSGPTARSATPTNHFRIERNPKPYKVKGAADILQAQPGVKKTPPAGGTINGMAQTASNVQKTPQPSGMLSKQPRPTMTQMTSPPPTAKRYGILEGSPPSAGSPNPGSQNEAFPPLPEVRPRGNPQIEKALSRFDMTNMPIPQPEPYSIDVGAMETPNPAYRPGPELSKMVPEQGMMDYMGPAPTVRDPNAALGYENYKARLQDKADLNAYHAGTYKGKWEGNDMGTPAPRLSPTAFAARAARPNAF